MLVEHLSTSHPDLGGHGSENDYFCPQPLGVELHLSALLASPNPGRDDEYLGLPYTQTLNIAAMSRVFQLLELDKLQVGRCTERPDRGSRNKYNLQQGPGK